MWSVGKGCPCRRPGPGEVRSRFQVAALWCGSWLQKISNSQLVRGQCIQHYHGDIMDISWFWFFFGVDGVQTTFPNVRSSTDPLNPLTVLTARFTRLGLALAVGQPWFGPSGLVMYSYGKWQFMFVLAMKKSEFSICSLAMFNLPKGIQNSFSHCSRE